MGAGAVAQGHGGVIVLVTGGGGFLGGALVDRLLTLGHQVRVLGRQDQPVLRARGVIVHRGDVAQAESVDPAVAGCDAVFHTAARVGSWGPAAEFESTNVGGTQNVIAACIRHGVQKLVYTSSPSVAHGKGDAEGINEDHPLPEAYDAEYPRTKAIAERLVRAVRVARVQHDGDAENPAVHRAARRGG